MSEQYTREDIIITKKQFEDSGLKIGDRVYYDDSITGIKETDEIGELVGVDWTDSVSPFSVKSTFGGIARWAIIIAVKEPEEKYIPFDLSKKEDRDALMGQRVVSKDGNYDLTITEFGHIDFYKEFGVDGDSEWCANGRSGENLLKNYIFYDGSPVGKEVKDNG